MAATEVGGYWMAEMGCGRGKRAGMGGWMRNRWVVFLFLFFTIINNVILLLFFLFVLCIDYYFIQIDKFILIANGKIDEILKNLTANVKLTNLINSGVKLIDFLVRKLV